MLNPKQYLTVGLGDGALDLISGRRRAPDEVFGEQGRFVLMVERWHRHSCPCHFGCGIRAQSIFAISLVLRSQTVRPARSFLSEALAVSKLAVYPMAMQEAMATKPWKKGFVAV